MIDFASLLHLEVLTGALTLRRRSASPPFSIGEVLTDFFDLSKNAVQRLFYLLNGIKEGRSQNYSFLQEKHGDVIVLKQILREFLSYHGVTGAALVGRDGFVIDMAGIAALDSDALGALCSSSINFFERGGAWMESGRLRKMMLEYQDGAVLLTPVTKEEFLVILTNTTEDLGQLTYRIATTNTRILAAM
jgi:predicted regulator of Ras-like GTPase activity (Roadblock/LC7/MglB family)